MQPIDFRFHTSAKHFVFLVVLDHRQRSQPRSQLLGQRQFLVHSPDRLLQISDQVVPLVFQSPPSRFAQVTSLGMGRCGLVQHAIADGPSQFGIATNIARRSQVARTGRGISEVQAQRIDRGDFRRGRIVTQRMISPSGRIGRRFTIAQPVQFLCGVLSGRARNTTNKCPTVIDQSHQSRHQLSLATTNRVGLLDDRQGNPAALQVGRC